jgi:hypothetical protein
LLLQTPRRFGLVENLVLDEPVCLEDVMPTLLDLAEIPFPKPCKDGVWRRYCMVKNRSGDSSYVSSAPQPSTR